MSCNKALRETYVVLKRKNTNKMIKKYYRSFGHGAHACRMCTRKNGLVRRLGLFICRQCFRDNAEELGFSRTI